jgi:hypothetical protein
MEAFQSPRWPGRFPEGVVMKAVWIAAGVLIAVSLAVWAARSSDRQTLLPAPAAPEAPGWSKPEPPKAAPKPKSETPPKPAAPQAKPKPKDMPGKLSGFPASKDPPIYGLPLVYHITPPPVPPEIAEPSPPPKPGESRPPIKKSWW